MKYFNNSGALLISTIEFLAKIVQNSHLEPLAILAKKSILDAWLGPKCASSVVGYLIVVEIQMKISPRQQV